VSIDWPFRRALGAFLAMPGMVACAVALSVGGHDQTTQVIDDSCFMDPSCTATIFERRSR
jgi:hypothetical protein